MDVFVSHSSTDLARAGRLVDRLREMSVSAWLASRELQVGDNYAEAIWRAVQSTAALIVLMSPSSIESEHVKREVNLALTLRKPILPVAFSDRPVAQDDLPGEWRYWLGVVQIVEASEEGEVARLIAQRLGTVTPSDEPLAPGESPVASQKSDEVLMRPANVSTLSAKTETQIRSALIQTAAAGGTFQMAVERARRLGASADEVRLIAQSLRDANLLDFDGEPGSGTLIRLT